MSCSTSCPLFFGLFLLLLLARTEQLVFEHFDGGVSTNVVYHRFSPEQRKLDPTILFLHGASFNSKIWDKIGSPSYFNERGVEVVTVDLPGFGETPSLPSRHQMTSFLRSFLDFLSFAFCILFLHSLFHLLLLTTEDEHVVVVAPSMSGLSYFIVCVSVRERIPSSPPFSSSLNLFLFFRPFSLPLLGQQVQP